MDAENNRRAVTVTRTEFGRYTATNERGGTIDFASAGTDMFTPVELLLAGIAGCTGIDVDILTSRRAEPTSFSVTADGEKLRDAENGNHMGPITVTFEIRFPDGDGGDAARKLLPEAVRRSHESLCTVSRTVMLPTEVKNEIV